MGDQVSTEWLRSRAKIKFLYAPEETSVRGNAMASGEDEVDTAYGDEIIRRLESGDDAAWFRVECRASWRGLSGSDYLGCCCYESFAEFEGLEGDYASGMRDEALRSLADKIQSITLGLEES